MDYVYICRDGDNEELRYSIRSIVKNLPEGRIWLIGGKPDWYTGDWVEVKNIGNKFENIVNCYKTIINNKDISDDFVLMNDDFFILKPINNIDCFYSGTLYSKIEDHVSKHGSSQYARALIDAKKKLILLGIVNPLNYDIHLPIKFNKIKLSKIKDLSLSPRSVYGNLFAENSVEHKDVKIYKHDKDFNINSSFISTEDNSFKLIEKQLKQMFPEPSYCEKV